MASPEGPPMVPLAAAVVPALLTLAGVVVTVWVSLKNGREDRRLKVDAGREERDSRQMDLALADSAGLRTALLERVRLLEKRADDYIEKYAALSGRYAQLQEEHEAALAENTALRAKVQDNETQIGALTTQVHALMAQVANLMQKLSAHQATCPRHEGANP